MKIDWEYNEDGFPAPDLGGGEDGNPRSSFTERDLEILASNPISLVAIDAANKELISMGQAIQIGYKPFPRYPQGLQFHALLGAFIELCRRVKQGDIVVSDEIKQKYKYVYELESEIGKNN